jgi:hypothetical protein
MGLGHAGFNRFASSMGSKVRSGMTSIKSTIKPMAAKATMGAKYYGAKMGAYKPKLTEKLTFGAHDAGRQIGRGFSAAGAAMRRSPKITGGVAAGILGAGYAIHKYRQAKKASEEE